MIKSTDIVGDIINQGRSLTNVTGKGVDINPKSLKSAKGNHSSSSNMGTYVKSSGSLENNFKTALTAPCPLPAAKGRIKKRKHDIFQTMRIALHQRNRCLTLIQVLRLLLIQSQTLDKQMSEGEYT